jgi:hypothetical protein
MPDGCISAVEYHHTPERGGGAGAALLYLAEQLSDPHGDPLCDRRLAFAVSTLKVEDIIPSPM